MGVLEKVYGTETAMAEKESPMLNTNLKHKRPFLAGMFALACFFVVNPIFAQNQILGGVELHGASKVEKTSGVWIDGQYIGYLSELKGTKKIELLPGEHDLSVRQNGYQDFTQKITVEPRLILTVPVKMQKAPDAIWPTITAELKVDVLPDRSAVFVDDKFVGHAGELRGLHSMLLSPGMHRIKIELPGFQTFESDVSLVAGQKSVVKTDLVKGSINQADSLIKQP
jgi:PEGA domain